MDMALAAVSLAIASGPLCLGLGVRRLRRRSFVSAVGWGVTGTALLTIGALAAFLVAGFYSYHRFTHEQAVAVIQFEKIADRYFRAELTEPGAEAQRFDVYGDEWQLDARVLKWRGFATALGLDPYYRLERLSGRYRDVEQERHGRRSVYALAPPQGMDLWRAVHRHGQWLPWVDAVYGSAVYVPMGDGARYAVSMANSGLVVRPRNRVAADAVGHWN